MASGLAEGEGGQGRAGPAKEFAAKRRQCPAPMFDGVGIELQLDVSAVVVSVTVSMPVRIPSSGFGRPRYVHQIHVISLCHKRQCMLQLQRDSHAFGYAPSCALKRGVGRTNPYNAGL